MHDAALHYEPDTLVVDVDEAPTIALPRTATDDLTMQVQLMGQWHRKMADADETACEVPFHLASTKTRREQLTHADGGLCSFCFTPREQRRAAENDKRVQNEQARRERRETIDSLFKALPPPPKGDR